MQCRGSSVGWEEIKSFPSILLEGQEKQAREEMFWLSHVMAVSLFPGNRDTAITVVQAQIPRKKHHRCIKRKVENRVFQETGQWDSLCAREYCCYNAVRQRGGPESRSLHAVLQGV